MTTGTGYDYGILVLLALTGLGSFFFLMSVALVVLVRDERKRVDVVVHVIKAFERRLRLR
jgi:hypothetical protein